VPMTTSWHRERKKKPTWPNTAEEFDHVGILVNEPPGTSRVALHLVVRRHLFTIWSEPALTVHGLHYSNPIFRREAQIASEKFFVSSYDDAGVADSGGSGIGCSRSRQSISLRTISVYAPEVTMKTPGEIEAAVCEGITRFEQEYMGRGPKDIRTHLLGDLLVVRLQGVLTAAEGHLVKSLPPEKGRDLLKQVRTHLIETARPLLEAMVHEITGTKTLSLHHDVSTVTGEEVLLFTLAESPIVRESNKR
jgi:uncharacterized protein YbcI